MARKRVVVSLGLVLALAFQMSVFAQEVSKTVIVSRSAKIGGQAIEKGNYTLKFTEGQDGEAIFLRGKREVAKAAYSLVKLTNSATEDSVIYKMAADGSIAVSRIEFKGMGTAIALK